MSLSESVWKQCASCLQDELPAQQFNTWIRPLRVSPASTAGELRLLAPNRFVLDWVADKFLNRIRELVAEFSNGQPLQVVLEITERRLSRFQRSRGAGGTHRGAGAQSRSHSVGTGFGGSVRTVVEEEGGAEQITSGELAVTDRRMSPGQRLGTEQVRNVEVEGAIKHGSSLNRNFTFKSFVEGKSNQLGLAAAQQIAR